MHIKESIKKKIISAAEGKLKEIIEEFISLKKSGKDYVGKCPFCDSEKAFTVSESKHIYKCFSCNKGGNAAVTFLMEAQNHKYVEALKYLGARLNIATESKPIKKTKTSFLDYQLKGSGLKHADIKIQVPEDDATKKVITKSVFESGTINQFGQVDLSGDDMLIWYFDLQGKHVMYQAPKKQTMQKLWRVRFQNPDLNKDSKGRPMKYKSPYGSGNHIYIPDRVRQLYKTKRAFDTLYIQEGEKKAEKACKHGIYSVGIMGIHNIAGKNKQLAYEFQHIIKACDVKNVVFMMDSDWDHISTDIKSGANVDYRPRTFRSAVINFRDYFKTFYNLGINIEIYFGHILPNEKNDKGIDDLLYNTLKTKEADLKGDLNELINKKEFDGKYVKLYKITTWTDMQFSDLWGLNGAIAFANKHKEILRDIPEFKIGKHKWRFNSDGECESAQPITDEEKYWDEDTWETKDGRNKKNLMANM